MMCNRLPSPVRAIATAESTYDAAPTLENRFVYGNYIDEVLLSWATVTANSRYYVHDHLYSVAAEINTSSAVTERYEYDAYGNPHVLDSNFADDADNLPDNDNPYLFTGRRVDYLNNADLTLQYNRNRYYDYHTGRWLTHDPLEYVDGLNLYEYVGTAPNVRLDAYGLFHNGSWIPGPLPASSPSESDFAFRFIWHFFFGRGAIWTDGADVLKEQQDVKDTVAKELKYVARPYCREAIANSGFASGTFSLNVSPILANENVFMKWTLNGAEGYRISGRYEARACSVNCPCEVKLLQVRHIWLDHGDLNLSSGATHWPDWLVWWFSGRPIQFGPGLGSARTVLHQLRLWANDFPVFIKWRSENFLRKENAFESFRESSLSGWPWPEQSPQ